jgi:CheY-like chemotaxis protein
MLKAQKLESLGVLAGGVAHDFNNLLTSIMGYAELARLEANPLSGLHNSLLQIEKATRRAADLTQQMLAYSGRGAFVIKLVNLARLIHEMTGLIEVSLPRSCVLTLELDPSVPDIHADAAQIRQLMMNLLLNAGEAIRHEHGEVILRTCLVTLRENEWFDEYQHRLLGAGDYAVLEVADNGEGMPAETLKRLFDPFFSTKMTGRGLGLPAVQGIVRGHRGGLQVESRPGRGTLIRILLPVDAPEKICKSTPEQGRRCVLVFDENVQAGQATAALLKRGSFDVLLTSTSEHALMIAEKTKPAPQFAVIDIGLDGICRDVCLRLKEHLPNLQIVLTGTYPEDEAQAALAEVNAAAYLAKPLTREALGRIIHDISG